MKGERFLFHSTTIIYKDTTHTCTNAMLLQMDTYMYMYKKLHSCNQTDFCMPVRDHSMGDRSHISVRSCALIVELKIESITAY